MTRILLCLLLGLPSSVLAAKVKEVPIHGIPGDGLTPLQIVEKVRESVESVKAACVSINYRVVSPKLGVGVGRASGVIISSDGLILTAAHVAKLINSGDCCIALSDGRKAAAKVLGYNKSTDTALLKISEDRTDWPTVAVGDKVPALGSICFIYSRPGALDRRLPAQLRIGRIKGRLIKPGKVDIIHTDLNMQAGDSGGPFFDIEGRLIGINCVSCGPGLSHVTSIELVHADFDRLKAGKRWGNAKLNPALTPPKLVSTQDKTIIKRVVAAVNRQMKDRYRPTMDVLRRKKAHAGDEAKVQDLLTRVDMMILLGSELSYGLDDPALIAKLPKLPDGSLIPYPVLSEGKLLTHGFPASKYHLLVKFSAIKGKKDLAVYINRRVRKLTFVGNDKRWDLALFRVSRAQLPAPVWPAKSPEIEAGTALLSPDMHGRLSWGIACDIPRAIRKVERLDPWLNKSVVSLFRGPYPPVIRHSLPLFASDAGTPVYTFAGELVGLHMGRIGCAFGVIIRIKDVRESVDKMLTIALDSTKE